MNKDYRILVISLAVIVISGGVIYQMMGQKGSEAVHQHDDMAGMEPQSGMQMPNDAAQSQIIQQIENMESQLKGDPQNYDLLVGLGNAYYDINDPSKAINYYEKALKIRPKDAGVIVDLGAMYHQLGQPDKAIELFNSAILLDPKLPQAYFNLGMVKRMAMNDPIGAAEAWKKYLELDPNSTAREFLQGEIEKALSGS